MAIDESFDDLMERVVAAELAPREHPHHPGEDVLLDALAGTLAPDRQSRLRAHLATCDSCRARWTQLCADAAAEAAELMKRSGVPSLSALARVHRRGQSSRAKAWMARAWEAPRSLIPWAAVRPVFVPLAAATAAVAISLSVTVPLLRAPLVASNEAYAELKTQIADLEDRLAALPAALARFAAVGGYTSSIQPPSVFSDPGEIVDEAQKLADGVQRALFVVGALQAQGLLDASRLDWGSLKTIEAVPGETWADIATFAFGMPRLWPLVWVLNSEVAGPHERLAEGAQIRVPGLLRLQQRP